MRRRTPELLGYQVGGYGWPNCALKIANEFNECKINGRPKALQ